MAKLSTKFFKVMVPGFEKRLLIPVAFYSSLDGMKLDKALIKSCQGSWHVKVERTVDGLLYFDEGWKDFVKHHSLKESDFVLFQHKESMIFHARVYELNGCEKELPPPNNLSNRTMTKSSEAQRDYQHQKGKESLNVASTSGDPHSFDILMTKVHSLTSRSFVTIPLGFVKSSRLGDKSKMILRVQSGKEWEVDITSSEVTSKDKSKPSILRTAIKPSGWSAFYKQNKLMDGDVCRFVLHDQMPKSRSKPVIMDVYIFRPRSVNC